MEAFQKQDYFVLSSSAVKGIPRPDDIRRNATSSTSSKRDEKTDSKSVWNDVFF